MTTHYDCRITTFGRIEPLYVWEHLLVGIQRKMLVREKENTENEHIHVYYETSIRPDAMRKRVRSIANHFGVEAKGNALYSTKTLIPDYDTNEDYPFLEAISYFYKENLPLYWDGIDPEEIALAREHNNQIRQDYKKSKKTKKKAIEQLEETMLDILQDPAKRYVREMVVGAIVSYYLHNNIVFNKFKVRQAYDYLLCKYDPTYMGTFISDVIHM